ncbi:glycoside hydrolase family 15 protein [Streptomyces sp. NPDC056638]|uniref:glycoside hydrolase family 15 protein n=1 Tax=Streptomyces sp. NPDC056638 TaxID=3345887 RepID=UPI0036B7EEDB
MSRLEEYGLIGDRRTSALICRNGSLAWMCLPRFDSPAAFAELLGTKEHGAWTLAPAWVPGAEPPSATRRRYLGDSLILESEWETLLGAVRVTAFMPPHDGPPRVMQIVEGIRGQVRMCTELRARFDYGRVKPWVQTVDGRTSAVAGPDSVWLDTTAETVSMDGVTYADFMVNKGDRIAFTLSWQPSHQSPPALPDPENALAATVRYWTDWSAQNTYSGPYIGAVVRSQITLKALCSRETGGIIAAPTTSLPEDIGGSRNWDYRYTWLRDAAITLSSLLRTGYREEARAWIDWLLRAVAGDPENLQIMYGLRGERDLHEREVPWLPGYEISAPVRIGNGAAGQLQLDVYGEVIELLHLAWQAGVGTPATAQLQLTLVQTLEKQWAEPDEGIWEVRGLHRHFVHSKMMAWVAVDRTIELIKSGETEGPLDQLCALRDDIHRDVCDRGYDPERNTFTQYYGSKELDASVLQALLLGFLPPTDKRVIGTIEAIQRELSTKDGFLLRYPTKGEDTGVDGLEGDEGAFLACSFWLVHALALIRRVEEATRLFERLLSIRNDLGLLAEEWDSTLQRQVGNYPQAFSMLALIQSALALNEAQAEQNRDHHPELVLPAQRGLVDSRGTPPAQQCPSAASSPAVAEAPR